MPKHYVSFDANNVLNGRYLEGLSEPPSNVLAIEVSEELWMRTMQEYDGVWMLDDDGGVTKHPFPPPTAEQTLAANQETQAALISQASSSMAPILMSLQLGDATDEETTTARSWQEYYRALKQVDITVPQPDWPVSP